MAEDSGFCLGEDGLLLNENPVNLRSGLGKKRAACDHPGCLESPGFLSKGCQYQQALPCPQTPGLLTDAPYPVCWAETAPPGSPASARGAAGPGELNSPALAPALAPVQIAGMPATSGVGPSSTALANRAWPQNDSGVSCFQLSLEAPIK